MVLVFSQVWLLELHKIKNVKDVDFQEEGEIVKIPKVGERSKDKGFWLVGKIHTKESSNVMMAFKDERFE